MKQVMIDLETLSTEHNACIVSIGAVKFDGKDILSSFKVNVTAESCKAAGLHLSLDTIDWWATQSPEARHLWMDDAIALPNALDQFEDWYGTRSLWTWGYGANFDIVIMENAFKAIGRKEPWKYVDVMCLRTVSNLRGLKVPRLEGVHHDALADARNQAKFLLSLMSGDA
jgi:DNA polymerase III epsilon subunit-like protein